MVLPAVNHQLCQSTDENMRIARENFAKTIVIGIGTEIIHHMRREIHIHVSGITMVVAEIIADYLGVGALEAIITDTRMLDIQPPFSNEGL